MRSRQLVLLLFWIISSCSESTGDAVEIVDPPMSLEEVNQSMSDIHFVGLLPNGQMIDFRPTQNFGNEPGYEYTGVGSTNFVEGSEGFDFDAIELIQARGSIKVVFDSPALIDDILVRVPIDSSTVDFQFGLVTTIGELKEQFSNSFGYPNSVNDWIVVFGLGSSKFKLEEFVEDEFFNVTDFVTYTVDPIRRSGFGSFYDFDAEWRYELRGDYFLGSSFNSRGDLGINPTVRGFSFALIGRYNLIIRE